jgi:hypothetical protein
LPRRLVLGEHHRLLLLLGWEDLELLLVFSNVHRQLLGDAYWELVGGGLIGTSRAVLTP